MLFVYLDIFVSGVGALDGWCGTCGHVTFHMSHVAHDTCHVRHVICDTCDNMRSNHNFTKDPRRYFGQIPTEARLNIDHKGDSCWQAAMISSYGVYYLLHRWEN